jgi:MFS family permease
MENLLEYTALQTAVYMLPGVILTGAFSPLVGQLSDQLNPRLFLFLGFIMSAVSMYWFATLGLQTEVASIVWVLIVRAGLGFVFPPLLNLGLRTLAREQISGASGLLNITRQIAGMGGIALAGVLLERWQYTYHLTGSEHLALTWGGIELTRHSVEGMLQRGGDVGELLHTKTQAVFSQYLSTESLTLAFQNCFVVAALIFVAAAIASLCIPGGEGKQS